MKRLLHNADPNNAIYKQTMPKHEQISIIQSSASVVASKRIELLNHDLDTVQGFRIPE
jgi:hypothetical protein